LSNIDLVPKTLQYGMQNCEKSTLVTTILIISFVLTSFILAKLHSKLFNKNINGKKKFLKIMPSFMLIIFIFLLLWHFLNKGLGYDKSIWQADYFVVFVLNLVVLIIFGPIYLSTVKLPDGSRILKQRRRWKQYLINGTFKLSFFLFWAFILTPYYVLLISHGEFIIGGYHALLSLILFITFCAIAYFTFGRSPFAPLLPGIIFWGACTSYYSWSFSMTYAVWLNFSAPCLISAGFLFGFGFLNFLEPILRGAKAVWAMLYIWLLGAVIVFFWTLLWWFYGYGQGGTGYEHFYIDSWYS
jgi:hypothetical protein